MSDLDQLGGVKIPARPPLTDEELKHRLGGAPYSAGDTVLLSKIDHVLKKITVGLGWDTPGIDDGGIDVDGSIFLLDKNDKTQEDSDFIFYNNSIGTKGAVEHLGDNRVGAGDGDDEQINIDLQALPFSVAKIVLVISIYDFEMREQNITMLDNIYIRLLNADTHMELVRFPINHLRQDKLCAAIIAGELVREGPSWLFTARGDAMPGGLGPIATGYGMMVTG